MVEAIIEYLKHSYNWLILLFIVGSLAYFIYSYIKTSILLSRAIARKKKYENEMAELDKEYEGKVKELEDLMKQKDKFLKRGKE